MSGASAPPAQDITDAWEAEKPALMPLPTAFDGFVELSKRVCVTNHCPAGYCAAMSREGCLITFDRNRFSVPASFANRPVSLHIYPERLVIVAGGAVTCTHERIIERSHRQPGRVIYDWRHYLALAIVLGPMADTCRSAHQAARCSSIF